MSIENQMDAQIAALKMGRYEMVKLALEWIEVKKNDEDYRRLTQAELITKALDDILAKVATPEKVEELRKKMKAKENKEEKQAEKK